MQKFRTKKGKLTSYIGNEPIIEIPDGVVEIEKSAFENVVAERIVVPETVEKIGNCAFIFSSISSISLPSSLKELGHEAFMMCPNLVGVDIPDGVKLSVATFWECANLLLVRLPSKLRSIPSRFFSGCSKLEDVTIPSSVTKIGAYAFSECAIRQLDLPPTLKTIGDGAFEGCDGLERVYIPASVTKIGAGAFSHCANLVEIVVDEQNEHYVSIDGNLYTKDKKTFLAYACAQKRSIFETLPSVETVMAGAFGGAQAQEIRIGKSVTSIGEDTFFKASCDVIDIQAPIKSIPKNCFFLSGVQQVNLPQGLESIGATAFRDAFNLTQLIIPDSVTSIGNDAFVRCQSLEYVNVPTSIKRIGSCAFDMCNSLNCNFQIPTTSILKEPLDWTFGSNCVITVLGGRGKINSNDKKLVCDLRTRSVLALEHEQQRVSALVKFFDNRAKGVKFSDRVTEQNLRYAKTVARKLEEYALVSIATLEFLCSYKLLSLKSAQKLIDDTDDNTVLDIKILLLDYVSSFSPKERAKLEKSKLKF